MTEPSLVLVARTVSPDAAHLAETTATELLGRHPGPLHHHCPTCGSIEHGRPSFDAPIAVSIAHTAGLTLVAVTNATHVGIDIEPSSAADLAWVTGEAIGKALGTGLTGGPQDSSGLIVRELALPGFRIAIALRADTEPEIRMLSEAPAGPGSPTTP